MLCGVSQSVPRGRGAFYCFVWDGGVGLAGGGNWCAQLRSLLPPKAGKEQVRMRGDQVLKWLRVRLLQACF